MLMPKTTLTALLLAIAAFISAAAVPEQAQANHNAWRWIGPVTTTWYGPGYYGNYFACPGEGRYAYTRRGVATNRSFLPCGAKVTLRYGTTIIKVRVIDRCPGCSTSGGPYSHPFDLTQQSSRDLCRCHHTLNRVRWYRGHYA